MIEIVSYPKSNGGSSVQIVFWNNLAAACKGTKTRERETNEEAVAIV